MNTDPAYRPKPYQTIPLPPQLHTHTANFKPGLYALRVEGEDDFAEMEE